MINLNKQPMVRKMSEASENLLFLLDLGRRKPKNQRRTLQEPTTDYDYLNQELIDLMDTYVLQFESINPNQQQITSDYARDLKNQLASKTIAEVKDITDFEQFGVEDPHKEIIFTDGSKISLPTSMIERANIKEQQRKNYMERVDKNNDGKISPLELQQSQNPSPLRERQLSNTQIQTNQELQNELQTVDRANPLREDQILRAQFDPTGGNSLFSNIQLQQKTARNLNAQAEPIVVDDKIINDNEYRYILNEQQNKLSIQKLQNDGSYKEVMNMNDFNKLQSSVQNEILNNIVKAEEKNKAEEERVAEYGIGMGQGMGGALSFGSQPTDTGAEIPTTQPTLETVAEKIAEEEPKKLASLGEKVKKGFQDLSTEQKAMMGLMGLDIGLEAVNFLGPARKEARDRIKILEDRRERGQLGVDEIQDAETMKYMTRPVRAMAEESEREQQAVMAGMGETRSAADLRRLRESRDAQMTDALSRAGQEVARQQMARKEAEKRELNQLQAYQQENLRNLTNRISGSVAQMAGTFGANVAAEADLQKELSPDTIEKYTKIIMDSDPSLTQEEARRMATDYGMERAKKKVDYAQFLSGVRNPPF
tara:strand:+ start:8002 stop:9786 length:1785 start_codon:yes stop_codon:yes gene_type:complete